MKIALVTDAWRPQVNGVVTTLSRVREELEADGHDFAVINPQQFPTFPCPRYPEIRLSIAPGRVVRQTLDHLAPDAIHIATEGPLGLAGRAYCRRRKIPFTTSYHTQFAQYLKRYSGLPLSVGYGVLRWFHGAAERTLVPTASIERELVARRFTGLRVWTRGVDAATFRPYPDNTLYADVKRPIFCYMGRVAVEKNIEAFLSADLPGAKLVVGDGPARASLEKRYPGVIWAGYQFGEDLARHIGAADVFVFPSRTDTFGVVMLEAMACGLPVAAYPVPGPRDVIKPGVSGAIDEDLAVACRAALQVDRDAARQYALGFTWKRCATMFLDNLAPIRRPAAA